MSMDTEFRGVHGWKDYYLEQVFSGPSAKCHEVRRLLLTAHQKNLLPKGQNPEMIEELALAAAHSETNGGNINYEKLAIEAGRPEERVRIVVELAQQFQIPPFRAR